MESEIVSLARCVSTLAEEKLGEIDQVAQMTKILALNARIEAGRIGAQGAAFTVVANEVSAVSLSVESLAGELDRDLNDRMRELDAAGAAVQGNRLADLALNMIDIIDRNLYERSCDVRWWATDSAVHEACTDPSPARCAHASERLGVILDSYTVYLDLWVTDRRGTVIANARPERYPHVTGSSVADTQWFRDAMQTRDGTEFAVADISTQPLLDSAQTAVYATAIRAGGKANGPIIGTLGIFFDWEPQARAVVQGVRLSDAEREVTRCLLIDRKGLVLACSEGNGVLSEYIDVVREKASGYQIRSDGSIIGYALTPGYETYEGMGWSGILIQH